MRTYHSLMLAAGLAITWGSLPLRANLGATGGVAIVSGTFSQECCTFPAEDGTQWLDLTGLNTNSAEGVQ